MRIPLPTTANDALNQGWNSGAQMIQNLADNQIRRNALMQQAQLENARMAQQNRQFQQTFGLDTQRFNADQAYKKQLLAMQLKAAANAAQAASDAHKEAALKYDPQAWANYLGGLQTAGNALDARMAQNQPSTATPITNALPIDTGSMSAMPDGQAVAYQDDSVPLSSAATSSATPMETNATPSLGVPGFQSSSSNFMGSGMSAGQYMISKALGINPMETPQAKLALANQEAAMKVQYEIAAAKARAEAIQGVKGGTTPTQSSATQLQKVVGATKNVLPAINDLIAGKHDYGISDFSPSKKADYMGATGAIIDQLLSIYNLPQTDSSKDLVAKMVMRQTNEPVSNWHARLQELKSHIMDRYNNASTTLNAHNFDTGTPISAMSDEDLQKIAAGNNK